MIKNNLSMKIIDRINNYKKKHKDAIDKHEKEMISHYKLLKDSFDSGKLKGIPKKLYEKDLEYFKERKQKSIEDNNREDEKLFEEVLSEDILKEHVRHFKPLNEFFIELNKLDFKEFIKLKITDNSAEYYYYTSKFGRNNNFKNIIRITSEFFAENKYYLVTNISEYKFYKSTKFTRNNFINFKMRTLDEVIEYILKDIAEIDNPEFLSFLEKFN